GAQTHLARQDALVAMAGNGLAYELLRLAVRIRVRGVDQVYSGIQRRVHDVDALLLVGIAIGAEHHGSERVCAHADAGSSERAIFHVFLLRSLRLAIVHARGVGTNDRLTSTRPLDSRRAVAARRQNPFAFAPSEAARSRRFRWPLPLPSS